MAWLTPVEEVPYPKKVWKVITSTFKSKLRCLRRPKCLIKTTKSNILARFSASKPSCHHHHHHVHLYYHDYQRQYDYSHQELPTQWSFPSVHVPKSLLGNATENKKDTAPVKKNSVESVETMDNYDEDDWQDTTDHFEDDYDDDEDEEQYAFVETSFNSKRLVLCGVNAKSESFIRNFYEGLKLERQIN